MTAAAPHPHFLLNHSSIDTLNTNGFIQIAFVVPNLRDAMDEYTQRLGISPWHLLEHIEQSEGLYRGKSNAIDLSVALGFCGSTMFELIQQHCSTPSVFNAKGFGFHHFGFGTETFDRECRLRKNQGDRMIYSARTPRGGRLAIFDSPSQSPLIEVLEMKEATKVFYHNLHRASYHSEESNIVIERAIKP